MDTICILWISVGIGLLLSIPAVIILVRFLQKYDR